MASTSQTNVYNRILNFKKFKLEHAKNYAAFMSLNINYWSDDESLLDFFKGY